MNNGGERERKFRKRKREDRKRKLNVGKLRKNWEYEETERRGKAREG